MSPFFIKKKTTLDGTDEVKSHFFREKKPDFDGTDVFVVFPTLYL